MKRNSNIELLRIISMFFITMSHFLFNATNATSFAIKNVTDLISMGGAFGVNIFILISCYFMVNKPFKFKRLLKTMKPVLFYSIFLTIPWLLYTSDYERIINWFINLLGNYWFVTAYIALVVAMPIMDFFLNKMSNTFISLTKWALFFITVILPGLFSLDLGFLRIAVFGYFYVYAYWYQNYDNKENINGLLVSLIGLVITYLGLFTYANYYQIDTIFITYVPQENLQNNVFQVLIAITVFKLFIQLKPKYNDKINQISTSVFSAYLIQQHGLVVNIREDIFPIFEIKNVFILIISQIILGLVLLTLFLYFDKFIKKFIKI